jgi:hypothetical protein
MNILRNGWVQKKNISEHKDEAQPAEKPEAEADTGFFQLASKALKKISGTGDVVINREGISKPASQGGPLKPLQLAVRL